MSLMTRDERDFAQAVAALAHCNPFMPDRIDCEKRALQTDFVDLGSVWHRSQEFAAPNTNVSLLAERTRALTEALRRRLLRGDSSKADSTTGSAATSVELRLYRDLVLYHAYQKYEHDFYQLLVTPGAAVRKVPFFEDFAHLLEHFLALPNAGLQETTDVAHLFACSYQIRRAFHQCFTLILGGSMPAAGLRAAVWQSIFTHDMARYRRLLYQRMGEFTTLITGPSGTGKELVAQTIGRSRYIPFDRQRGCFVEEPSDSFYALNLSALSPTVIESELFGHRKGSFTGAVSDRVGWLEACSETGTIFLDEIGDVDPVIQVKLLRVLQTRGFQRLGETERRTFCGKVIAATNRDLDEEIHSGRFREDFYYRLCSDRIETPSLADQLAGEEDELRRLVVLLAERLLHSGSDESEALADETMQWIRTGMPADYSWPGNVRELEQCVRNVLIRKEYLPPTQLPTDSRGDLIADQPTAEELLQRYCTKVYAETGSYVETARRLDLDRRTVKAKVDPQLLAELRD